MEREATELLISQLIAPVLEKLGYALVRVQLQAINNALTLQIMAERVDGKGMLVEDCQAITHGIDLLLDEADPIPGAYALEVSSPGIDRPLTRPQDYTNWAGFEAKIVLGKPLEGGKNHRGILRGLQDDVVQLEVADKIIGLPRDMIVKAQLVLTDTLIKATAQREAAASGLVIEELPAKKAWAPKKPKTKA